MNKTKTHERYWLYLDKPYGNNLWAIKQELGLSNSALERLTGINYGAIGRIERGDQPISENYKKLIEKATNYEVEIYE